jgi:pimeloyl-ACP methyl ester carboxylesterase
VEYLTAGHGLPSIVALSGLNMPLKTWALVFEELAETSTVFVYNRLGVGASHHLGGRVTRPCDATV